MLCGVFLAWVVKSLSRVIVRAHRKFAGWPDGRRIYILTLSAAGPQCMVTLLCHWY